MQNSFKNSFKNLFSKSDFETSHWSGCVFINDLYAKLPGAVITQNGSQASAEVFEGSPGPDDACDLHLSWSYHEIDFEITGDKRYELAGSKFFLFNHFAVKKLLKRPSGYAVYYLGKENPPLFFIKKATEIAANYTPRNDYMNARGDDGVKYHIPVKDWMTFDSFVEQLKSK